MKVVQLLDSRMDNFSYILYDESTKEAAIIDPSFDKGKILSTLKDLHLKPKYIILTHEHYDHIQCVDELKKEIKTSVLAHHDADLPFSVDQKLNDGDVIEIGKSSMKVIHTPGHSPGGICLYGEKKLISGDVVFVGKCGRTDLPGSDPEKMRMSLETIKKLPDDVEIFPGHDYGDAPTSTIGKEKKHNPFFT